MYTRGRISITLSLSLSLFLSLSLSSSLSLSLSLSFVPPTQGTYTHKRVLTCILKHLPLQSFSRVCTCGTRRSLRNSSMHTHTHTHTHMCMCIYIYVSIVREHRNIYYIIYIYIHKNSLYIRRAGLYTYYEYARVNSAHVIYNKAVFVLIGFMYNIFMRIMYVSTHLYITTPLTKLNFIFYVHNIISYRRTDYTLQK